jgi:hypothetical protein
MSAEDELVRLIRRLVTEDTRRLGQFFMDGTVESVAGTAASIRKADPTAPPTPGFYVPPDLQVLAGDHVWVYDGLGYKLVLQVLNRNAVLPPGVTLYSPVQNGAVRRTGTLTPPALAGNVDNYAPDGGTAAYRWLQALGGANRTTSGILAEPDGTEHELVNADTAGNWTLSHLGAGSSAANQIWAPGAVDYVLSPGAAARVYYDGTGPFWRIASK